MSIRNWLKYYVYLRMLPNDKTKKVGVAGPVIMTYMVSGIWHGFYPAWQVCFLSIGIFEVVFKFAVDLLGPLINIERFPKALVTLVAMIYIHTNGAYILMFFF